MKTSLDIDFVILWVNGNDPEWRRKKQIFAPTNVGSLSTDDTNADCRYRADDKMLRYWFRGIEQNAPWVHRIYFVSAGQAPAWLNGNHPKLQIVDHEDFIPKTYLPTFNSRTIQFNLHRIEMLSEHFVLFDDDCFLLSPHSPDDYFRESLPVLGTYLGFLNVGYSNWHRVMWNDTALINEQFNVAQSIWRNRHKWFNIKKLGLSFAAYNLMCFLVNRILPVHFYGHMPQPHLKTSYDDIWTALYDVLDLTCSHKTRSDDQVNLYLLCAWNQMKGFFYPAPIDPPGKWYSLKPDIVDEVCDVIRKRFFPAVCLNDSSNLLYPESTISKIEAAFSDIFPEESSFER